MTNPFRPLLYPEKSRLDLELDYHLTQAALYIAAEELLIAAGATVTPNAIDLKLAELCNRCTDMASQSAQVRLGRNMAGRLVHVLLAALLLSAVPR